MHTALDSDGPFLKRWPRHQVRTRSAGRQRSVQIYRRDDRAGRGPCISLYVNGVETIRCDLFELEPHYHRHPVLDRVAFPPWSTRAELVEHALALMRLPDGVAAWARAELG